MDKRVIFAVAGSGKTTYIIDKLNESKKSLIITYTENNFKNLRHKIIKKFGFFPTNIKVFTYFTFIHSFCYKPLLWFKYQTKGLTFKDCPIFANDEARFIDKSKRLYHSRISNLLDKNRILKDVNNRVEKYFDNLFIDEIQDFSGHDFNFLKKLSQANIDILFVGDFYQHTYDTSRDCKVNCSLHKDYAKYQLKFRDMGVTVELNALKKSYRCSPAICNFISQKLGIEIESHRKDDSEIHFISDEQEAQNIISSNEIVKLFYQGSSRYYCFSRNWGESKGEDNYNDVCVVLYKKALECFSKDELNSLPQASKNKLYVACSRARNNLYFIPIDIFKDLALK